jgi:hypothetical protein
VPVHPSGGCRKSRLTRPRKGCGAVKKGDRQTYLLVAKGDLSGCGTARAVPRPRTIVAPEQHDGKPHIRFRVSDYDFTDRKYIVRQSERHSRKVKIGLIRFTPLPVSTVIRAPPRPGFIPAGASLHADAAHGNQQLRGAARSCKCIDSGFSSSLYDNSYITGVSNLEVPHGIAFPSPPAASADGERHDFPLR